MKYYETHSALRRILFALLLFLLSLISGTTGYVIIEGYSPKDALYMSVITFSTVGFNEVNPLTSDGKTFTTIFIMVNLIIFAYTVSAMSSFFFEGELKKVFKNMISSRELKKLKNHVIVCGFGKNGAQACEELEKSGADFVVIERDIQVIEDFSPEKNYNFINGNATLDETLVEAGVEKAAVVITALPSDADNVFITLTARGLQPQINVIAKATEVNSEKKLLRAGASHVVLPDKLGGIHMANLITKPFVIEFLELLNGVGESSINLEEIEYDSLKPEYCNQTLKTLNIRHKTGATVIAIKDDKKGFIFNPHSEQAIHEGDVLIVLGTEGELSQFRKIYYK